VVCKRVLEQGRNRKLSKRNVLRKFGLRGLTSRDAQRMLEDRAMKTAQEAQKKQD
jgi:hypothetical protein